MLRSHSQPHGAVSCAAVLAWMHRSVRGGLVTALLIGILLPAGLALLLIDDAVAGTALRTTPGLVASSPALALMLLILFPHWLGWW